MQPASRNGGELGEHRPHLLCAVELEAELRAVRQAGSVAAVSSGRPSRHLENPARTIPGCQEVGSRRLIGWVRPLRRSDSLRRLWITSARRQWPVFLSFTHVVVPFWT